MNYSDRGLVQQIPRWRPPNEMYRDQIANAQAALKVWQAANTTEGEHAVNGRNEPTVREPRPVAGLLADLDDLDVQAAKLDEAVMALADLLAPVLGPLSEDVPGDEDLGDVSPAERMVARTRLRLREAAERVQALIGAVRL